MCVDGAKRKTGREAESDKQRERERELERDRDRERERARDRQREKSFVGCDGFLQAGEPTPESDRFRDDV